MGLEVGRIAGGDRYETAARIAAELPPTGEVFVVEGHNADPRRGWPDALSASSLAASLRAPILLTARDVLPGPTADALDAGTDATIVGGPVSVSPAVHGALDVDRRP